MAWIETVDVDELEFGKSLVEAYIEKMWADPQFRLTRNRYEIHDALVLKIRRIDERLDSLRI
jgi:hypothetical protein